MTHLDIIIMRLAAWWNRGPQPGDRWTDGHGRVHVLSVRDGDGYVSTGDVRL